MRIGVVSNPLSHGNRRGGGLGAIAAPDLLTAAPRTGGELAAALDRFARAGVGLIAIDGGDGTLREVLTGIDAGWQGAWPALALLPSGKTNAVAGDVGHSGAGARGMRRLLAARAAGTLGRRATERAALEVRWAGRRVLGFLLGAAAFSDGVRLANERLHPAGLHRGAAVIAAMGGVLRRRGEGAGECAELRVDGHAVNGARHFLILASTLDRLTPGLRPFRDSGAGPLNWLDVSAPPVRPISGLALAALGRWRPWMERSGYAGGRARLLELALERPFVIDGEVYPPDGPVAIAASRPIRFVRA